MTSETTEFFENLYDLLRESRPNMGKILTLVEERLDISVCLIETAAAQEQLVKFLNSLKQFFVQNQKKQELVAELIRVIETEGMLELAAFRDALGGVMEFTAPSPPVHHGTTCDIPASFMARVRQIFPTAEANDSASGSHNEVLTEVSQQGPGTMTVKNFASEKEWQQQLVAIGLQLIDAYPGGHLVDAATTLFFQGQPVDGTRRGSQKIETLLRKQLLAYHRIAGTLRSNMEDGRQKAARLKKRVDQLEEAITASQKSLFIDPSTAIPSRASFTAHLHRHLERAMHLGELFSLGLIHVEDFTTVLAELDADEGEQLVKTVAHIIRSEIGAGDFLARLGVDRFALIFPSADKARSASVAANVGAALNSTEFQLSKGVRSITARVGALTFEAGMTAQDMLVVTDELADSAVAPDMGDGAKNVLNVMEA